MSDDQSPTQSEQLGQRPLLSNPAGRPRVPILSDVSPDLLCPYHLNLEHQHVHTIEGWYLHGMKIPPGPDYSRLRQRHEELVPRLPKHKSPFRLSEAQERDLVRKAPPPGGRDQVELLIRLAYRCKNCARRIRNAIDSL